MKTRLALSLACCLALTACSTFSNFHVSQLWPFHKKAKPGPEAVNELTLVNTDGSPASFPQYWKRNTLVIDLSGVSGTGNVAARLPDASTWPVRVAVRVRPGSVQQIEVQGEERNVLPVSTEGSENIDLVLAHSVYTAKTAAIYISWGSMPVFAEAAPAPEAPAFTSPTVVPPTPGEASPSASEIVSPKEAAPAGAQPSPPPGN